MSIHGVPGPLPTSPLKEGDTQAPMSEQLPEALHRILPFPGPVRDAPVQYSYHSPLETSCFITLSESSPLLEATDVGNLISGSSAFSKSCLTFWKFMVHILFKPGLENFEHYFASV